MPEKKPNLKGLLRSGSAVRGKTASSQNTSDKLSGKFASIGGIEHRPVQSFEKPEEPIDFSEIGGKVVREAPTSTTPRSRK